MGPGSKLAIVGGIMINRDGEDRDLFQPIRFTIRDSSGNVTDALEEVRALSAQNQQSELSAGCGCTVS